MSYIHKTRGRASSTCMTIISSVWDCIYCSTRLAIPERWIPDVEQQVNGKRTVILAR